MKNLRTGDSVSLHMVPVYERQTDAWPVKCRSGTATNDAAFYL